MKFLRLALLIVGTFFIVTGCVSDLTGKLTLGLPSSEVKRIAGEPSETVTSLDFDAIDMYKTSLKCPTAKEFWIYKRLLSDDTIVGFNADGKVACVDQSKVLDVTTTH